jgi:hypothetical protein
MPLLGEALDVHECVIKVMGALAGADRDAIFGRKIDDCETVGQTFWVAKSAKWAAVDHATIVCSYR